MNKKPNQPPADTLSDEQLFQQAVEGVVPLRVADKTDSRAPRPRPRLKPQLATQEEMDNNHDNLLEADPQGCTETDSTHRKNGVKKRTLQRLIRGQYPLGDQFDLHHLNAHSGKIELLRFIAWSQQRGLKCIRIIHGKGLHSDQGPKLKTMTRQVLREHAGVMAFTSCKPSEGGEGATDVLLKSCSV